MKIKPGQVWQLKNDTRSVVIVSINIPLKLVWVVGHPYNGIMSFELIAEAYELLDDNWTI